MNGIRDNAQAINTIQADAAFGMVAVADINHRDLHREAMSSPLCSGKRRRLSKRPYASLAVPVRPVAGLRGPGGTPTGSTPRPLWRQGELTGGPAATLWATLIIQRALSS